MPCLYISLESYEEKLVKTSVTKGFIACFVALIVATEEIFEIFFALFCAGVVTYRDG